MLLNLDKEFQFTAGNAAKLHFESFVFSGGEVHIKLSPTTAIPKEVLIAHRINNSQNLMELLLAADAVRRKFEGVLVNCYIPYIPYARQDDVMDGGEAFSLKVFATILATGNFHKVHCLDPHSIVSKALIPNLVVESPQYLIKTAAFIEKDFGPYIMLAPDGGALKKIYKNAKFIGYEGDIYCAGKIRNLATGKIVRTSIDATPEDLWNKTVWIQDDICDGGRTFIELAKQIREMTEGHVKIVLSVSHAIISHGEEELAKWIDKIYTTDSIKNDESALVKRFKL